MNSWTLWSKRRSDRTTETGFSYIRIAICLSLIVIVAYVAFGPVVALRVRHKMAWISKPDSLFPEKYLYVRVKDSKVEATVERGEGDPEWHVFVEGSGYGSYLRLESAKRQAERWAH